MPYSLRPYRDSDAESLSALAVASIRAVGALAYSPEQVEAWANRHGGASMYRERVAGGHVIFAAVDGDDQPVAYALLEPDGHLDRLYCHPEHTRKGLAARVLAAAEDRARKTDLDRLYTEASELARPAFERAGYVVERRHDFIIAHAGREVPIHNYAMEKRLS